MIFYRNFTGILYVSAFGLGSMIYGFLEVGQYFEYGVAAADGEELSINYLAMSVAACRSIFIFSQMYFIFLNTKVK